MLQPNIDNKSVVGGGASRLWFGPETGPYSVFFKPGMARTSKNIEVAYAVSIEPFAVKSRTGSRVEFEENISLDNNVGFNFKVKVERKIELFSTKKIQENLFPLTAN